MKFKMGDIFCRKIVEIDLEQTLEIVGIIDNLIVSEFCCDSELQMTEIHTEKRFEEMLKRRSYILK